MAPETLSQRLHLDDPFHREDAPSAGTLLAGDEVPATAQEDHAVRLCVTGPVGGTGGEGVGPEAIGLVRSARQRQSHEDGPIGRTRVVADGRFGGRHRLQTGAQATRDRLGELVQRRDGRGPETPDADRRTQADSHR